MREIFHKKNHTDKKLYFFLQNNKTILYKYGKVEQKWKNET